MAFNLASIRRGVQIAPPRIIIYGTHGVGKTSFGAGADSPILLPFEEGEGLIDIPRFPLIGSYADLMGAIGSLVSEQHDFKTAIIDTIDWMEPVVLAETCRTGGWKSIEDPGFGKGWQAADGTWREVLGGFDALRERGMQVIVLAHSEIKNYADPATDNYDRHQLKLQKRAWGILQEWADVVGFLSFRTVIEKSASGFGKQVAKGKGFGERVLYLEERPAYYAKNRYRLPPEIKMPQDDPSGMYKAFAAALNQSVAQAAKEQ